MVVSWPLFWYLIFSLPTLHYNLFNANRRGKFLFFVLCLNKIKVIPQLELVFFLLQFFYLNLLFHLNASYNRLKLKDNVSLSFQRLYIWGVCDSYIKIIHILIYSKYLRARIFGFSTWISHVETMSPPP